MNGWILIGAVIYFAVGPLLLITSGTKYSLRRDWHELFLAALFMPLVIVGCLLLGLVMLAAQTRGKRARWHRRQPS